MANSITCPLCETKEITTIEKIKKNELNLAQKKITGKDFSYLINSDIFYCECKNCHLKFFSPLITGDEEFYNSLQHLPWYYSEEKEEYAYVQQFITKEDKVLDVGCGKGAFSKYLNKENYTGLDFSTNAKEMAEKNNITIKNESIQSFANANPQSFDVVCSFQVLEHVSNPRSFIESKILALKPGGKLIVSVPSNTSFLKYAVNHILDMPPHHVTHWSDETLKFISSSYNLDIIEFHHEKLQEIHKKMFISTTIQLAMLKHKLIDYSLSRKLVNMTSSLISKLVEKGLQPEMFPNGHSVTVVYKKN